MEVFVGALLCFSNGRVLCGSCRADCAAMVKDEVLHSLPWLPRRCVCACVCASVWWGRVRCATARLWTLTG